MDRGYDDNKIFFKLEKLEQDYVIRLTAKRKLLLSEAIALDSSFIQYKIHPHTTATLHETDA